MRNFQLTLLVLLAPLSSAYDTALDVTDVASFVQINSQVKRHDSAKLDASGLFDPSDMPPPTWWVGPQIKDDTWKSEVYMSSGKARKDDLVFSHMPFNFGNTIEKIAMFPHSKSRMDVLMYVMSFASKDSFAGVDPKSIPSWEVVHNLTQPDGAVWGHFNPDLLVKANKTGCPLYLTPPRDWPEDAAKKYFGNKQVFGVLRDPYEKLVAQFRGGFKDYGGSEAPAGDNKCDVNAGVKALLKKMEASGDMTLGGCANIPQAEYFEGEYGIKIPVDNWRFPKSSNELFEEHGYPWHIEKADILHVFKCKDSWSGDFDDETRLLVKKIYKKDFDLICKHFGHCDQDQNTCIQGVTDMCPTSLFTWDPAKNVYCPAEGVDVKAKKIRVREECLAATPEVKATAKEEAKPMTKKESKVPPRAVVEEGVKELLTKASTKQTHEKETEAEAAGEKTASEEAEKSGATQCYSVALATFILTLFASL